MKTIETIQVWNNGDLQNATVFNLVIAKDNLSDYAIFEFILFDNMLNVLTRGNLTMNGEEYQNWDADPSANEFAYNWAANLLHITITGNYIKPE